MLTPMGPVYAPLLKNYTELPIVEVVQENLNTITKAWDARTPYVPSSKALAKMGRKTFSDLSAAGFLLDPDGKYGRLTAGRVVVFQDRNGLSMIDGIIGPAETWPALDKVMERLKIEKLKIALSDRPNLSKAKQTTPGGADCGYFAALAVAEAVKTVGGPSMISFDRDDALAARDKFDTTVDDSDRGKERTVKPLDPFDAVPLLESLGVKSFTLRVVSAADYASAEKVVTFLDQRMNNGRLPVMVGLQNFVTPALGHWVGILAKKQIMDFNLYLIYDSSGVLPSTMKRNGSIAGVTTVWVDELILRGFFAEGDATKIVSRF